ncbi:hypothetical protein EV702DRAFT_201776 [Suillus placidus]|uniref:Uncharacterized protein n=1 Tax=Suillus placidus TaxID=48579 RepID=A0A9P6ZWY4_9AGAM|nr:hypothetical protein EV702DRAFT_201776 [Suillus placidus]
MSSPVGYRLVRKYSQNDIPILPSLAFPFVSFELLLDILRPLAQLHIPLKLQARLPRCHPYRMYNRASSNLDLCYPFLATWPLIITLTLMQLRLALTTAEITLRRLRSIRFLLCVLLVLSYSLPLSRSQDLHKLPGKYPHYHPMQPLFIILPWGWPNPESPPSLYYVGSYQQVVNHRCRRLGQGLGDKALVTATRWIDLSDVYPSYCSGSPESGRVLISRVGTKNVGWWLSAVEQC